MDIITQAQIIATQKHVLDNHQLYGWLPYTHHLMAVADTLIEFDFESDKNLLASAWLHDIIEDTRGKPNELKARDIEEMFGEDIAQLVGAVTSEEGANRKIRNALTYPKIRLVGERAVALKLADRLSNVRNGGSAFKMYQKEHDDFRHGIYLTTGPHFRVFDMQEHLDDLLGY